VLVPEGNESEAGEDDTPEKAPWEDLYDTFMPLLISMTFNSPLQFWELNYMQQHDKFDLEEDDHDKLVPHSPSLTTSMLRSHC
jgi:hypothetical protein